VTDDDDGSLFAMIHATRTSFTYASDASMAIGSHEPNGPTVGLHSLCVHPGWRAKGLGTRILREYVRRIGNEKGVKRIALIAHDELVPFYERSPSAYNRSTNCRVGFVNQGVSESKHGGITWYNCVYSFGK
jgi:GNAT superfamily N-acetyltransferase